MKNSRRIDNVRKAKNDAQVLQRYIAEIDWDRFYETKMEFEKAGPGEPVPSELLEVYELVLAVVSHPNVNCATVREIWERVAARFDPWPLDYVCEIAKQITHEEVIRSIYCDMYVNAYTWPDEYWDAMKAVMEEKPSVYAEYFKKLVCHPVWYLPVGWESEFEWPEGFFPDTAK